MLNCNPVTGEAGNSIIVGRAAVAIYLVLENLKNGKAKENIYKVIVPANICYAAVLPIILAGFEPLFCDVDKKSGNVTYNNIVSVMNDSVIAVIIPHMYGNPVDDMQLIANVCKEKNIVTIEDCASLMAINEEPYLPGSIGDYVVYSTGYSKTLDLGYGGILYSSKHSLDFMEKLEDELPICTKDIGEYWNGFSKIYRVLRNEGQNSKIARDFFCTVRNSAGDTLLYKIDSTEKNNILFELKKLPEVIDERRKKYNLYNDLLKAADIDKYPMNEFSVPWRYNVLVKSEQRKRMIEFLLQNHVPVSDWYPCVTPVFGNYDDYPGANWHESHILNFPLLISDDEICYICNKIKEYLQICQKEK